MNISTKFHEYRGIPHIQLVENPFPYNTTSMHANSDCTMHIEQ